MGACGGTVDFDRLISIEIMGSGWRFRAFYFDAGDIFWFITLIYSWYTHEFDISMDWFSREKLQVKAPYEYLENNSGFWLRFSQTRPIHWIYLWFDGFQNLVTVVHRSGRPFGVMSNMTAICLNGIRMVSELSDKPKCHEYTINIWLVVWNVCCFFFF